ncbi:MAG: GYF domain-containing protein [Planctomycetota bacterium]
MSQWYYQMLGEEFGPVSTDSLRQILADGLLETSDLVRPFDSTDWRPVNQTDLISVTTDALSDDPGEMLTDLADLNFQFEESGASDRSARKPKSRSQPPSAAQVPEEPSPPNWFHQFFGQVLGPIPLQELVQMAESGNLNEGDAVRCGVTGEWQPAGDVPELAAAFILGSGRDVHRGPQASAGSGRSLFAAAAAQAEKVKAQADAERAAAAAAQPADAQKPATPAPASTAKPVGSPGSPGRRGGKKSEEQLVNNILSEVFAEPAPPRQATAAIPAESPAASAGSVAPETRVPGSMAGAFAPSSSPPAASGWSAASSASAAAAPRPSLSSPAPLSRSSISGSKSSGGGFSIPGRQVLVVVAVIALAVAGWFGYGSLNRMISIDEPKYIRRVEESLAALEKLSPKASQTELDNLHSEIYQEFNQYIRDMTGAGAVSGNSKNCLAAINRLTELIRVDPTRNAPLRQKLMADAKQKVSDWKANK